MNFGIGAIHHGESVADLGTAGHVSKIVSPIGEDRGNPVGGSPRGRPSRNPELNTKRASTIASAATPSPSRTSSTLSAEPLKTRTMIPQESATVIPLVTECGIL